MSSNEEKGEYCQELFDYLLGEVYGVPPVDREDCQWRMSQEWLGYCRETLKSSWEVPVAFSHPPYLFGKEVIVDENYTIPKMVKRS